MISNDLILYITLGPSDYQRDNELLNDIRSAEPTIRYEKLKKLNPSDLKKIELYQSVKAS
jgi:hypothetical protein